MYKRPPKDTDNSKEVLMTKAVLQSKILTEKFKMITFLNGVEIENVNFKTEKEMQKMYRQRIDEGYGVRVYLEGKKLAYSEAEARYREKGKKWLVRSERRC